MYKRQTPVLLSLVLSGLLTAYLFRGGRAIHARSVLNIVSVYCLLSRNLFTFCLFGVDKVLAMRNKFRIPEKELFRGCEYLGWVGGILGMMLFAHKVRKKAFILRVVEIAVVNCMVIVFVLLVVAFCVNAADPKYQS